MREKKENNKKKWIRRRHAVVTRVIYPFVWIYCRAKYGLRVERFREQQKRPYLILLNHQTPFDQFFVGMSFKGAIYYLATEDIFSKGWVSSLIRWLLAPIPIKKQTMDVKAVLNCIRVVREGGTICIAPEGNRTYSGRTEYMSPAIATLARKLGIPIVLYRIEGGYGAQPRWSDVVRRGKVRSYVSRVIYPEEYAQMSDDELFSAIEEELYVNEAVSDGEFRHRKSAEYLERAIYVCHECGLSSFESHGQIMKCKKCGREVRYLPTKELCGEGFELPFRFVADWYDYQCDFVNSLDLTELTSSPLYTERADIYKVIPCERKEPLFEDAEISLFGDRVVICSDTQTLEIYFESASAFTVLGRNKLNIYFGDEIYQVKGSKRFNSLKYLNFYHRHKNIVKGEKDAKFLGL